MERFENIPEQVLVRLPVGNRRLQISSAALNAEPLRVIGVSWVFGNYKIFD